MNMLARVKDVNKFGRSITKGEKGIPAFKNGQDALTYLFDVTQTNGPITPYRWELRESERAYITKRLGGGDMETSIRKLVYEEAKVLIANAMSVKCSLPCK